MSHIKDELEEFLEDLQPLLFRAPLAPSVHDDSRMHTVPNCSHSGTHGGA